MDSLNKFVDIVLNTWKSNFGNLENFYELFEEVGTISPDKPIGQKRDWLIKQVSKNWLKGLNRLFPNKNFSGKIEKGDFYYMAPTAGPAGPARIRFASWRKDGSMSYDYAISLTVFICMICINAKKLFTPQGYEYFEDNDFPSAELLSFLCDTLKIDDAAYVKKMSSQYEYMLTFLLSSIFYCLAEKKGLAPTHEINEWIRYRFNELSKIANHTKLSTYQKKYYELLWKENSMIDIRDLEGGDRLSSIRENVEIANLYVIPSFFSNGIEIDKPVDSSKRFSNFIIANSGCGKTTFIQAIITSCICEQLNAFNSDYVNPNSLDNYKLIRKQLGIETSFFPIVIKASMINDYDVSFLNLLSLIDIAARREDSLEGENLYELVSMANREDKVLLLIDALDEIDSGEHRHAFGQMIDKFVTEFPSSNILITSRAIDFRDYYDCTFYAEVNKLSLELFDESKIRELISKWMENDVSLSSDENVEKKYRYFIENKYLTEMAKNPYMLTHSLHYRANHVNAMPQEIISYVINRLIEKRWPIYKYAKYGITVDYMREILSYIAWEMADTNSHSISSRNLVTRFCNAADQIESYLEINRNTWTLIVKEMNTRAGLLILESTGYVFQCNVIEYFLASEWIISKLIDKFRSTESNQYEIINSINDMLPRLKDNYWADIVLMMFSPDSRYNLHKRDKITPALYKYLLYKSAESLDIVELRIIGSIFIGLCMNTFGRNRITTAKKEAGGMSPEKQQIIRFLVNNSFIFDDISELYLSDDFRNECSELKKNNLLNIKEEEQ